MHRATHGFGPAPGTQSARGGFRIRVKQDHNR